MSSLQAFSPVATEQAFALWRVQCRAGRWFVSIMQPDPDAWERQNQVVFGTLAFIVGSLEAGCAP